MNSNNEPKPIKEVMAAKNAATRRNKKGRKRKYRRTQRNTGGIYQEMQKVHGNTHDYSKLTYKRWSTMSQCKNMVNFRKEHSYIFLGRMCTMCPSKTSARQKQTPSGSVSARSLTKEEWLKNETNLEINLSTRGKLREPLKHRNNVPYSWQKKTESKGAPGI